eukprot:scaffold266_cov391-Prasinococcus_capsulatus_cf.AAC.39
MKLDDHFFLDLEDGTSDVAMDVRRLCRQVDMDLLIVRGSQSHVVSETHAQTMATMAVEARSTACIAVEGDHFLGPSSQEEFSEALHDFLAHAQEAFHVPSGELRRPEQLGIRPLPQYSTIEEAKKALGPRNIPSREAILAELAKLRVRPRSRWESLAPREWRAVMHRPQPRPCPGLRSRQEPGEASDSDDDDARGSGHLTKLIKEDSEYFGFMG